MIVSEVDIDITTGIIIILDMDKVTGIVDMNMVDTECQGDEDTVDAQRQPLHLKNIIIIKEKPVR